jgi:hypothetical protein
MMRQIHGVVPLQASPGSAEQSAEHYPIGAVIAAHYGKKAAALLSHLQKSRFQDAAPPHSSVEDDFSVFEMIVRPCF